jgi:hypothetical protein
MLSMSSLIRTIGQAVVGVGPAVVGPQLHPHRRGVLDPHLAAEVVVDLGDERDVVTTVAVEVGHGAGARRQPGIRRLEPVAAGEGALAVAVQDVLLLEVDGEDDVAVAVAVEVAGADAAVVVGDAPQPGRLAPQPEAGVGQALVDGRLADALAGRGEDQVVDPVPVHVVAHEVHLPQAVLRQPGAVLLELEAVDEGRRHDLGAEVQVVVEGAVLPLPVHALLEEALFGLALGPDLVDRRLGVLGRDPPQPQGVLVLPDDLHLDRHRGVRVRVLVVDPDGDRLGHWPRRQPVGDELLPGLGAPPGRGRRRCGLLSGCLGGRGRRRFRLRHRRQLGHLGPNGKGGDDGEHREQAATIV